MTNDELKDILINAYSRDYPATTVKVTGDGRHFAITVVSTLFNNLKKLPRQQKVYEIIGKYIGNEVHAVVLNLFTPEEQANNKTT